MASQLSMDKLFQMLFDIDFSL